MFNQRIKYKKGARRFGLLAVLNMGSNGKRIRIVKKLIDAGYDTEKAIVSMGMEEVLTLPGITIGEMNQIRELQKSIKQNKVITYLGTIEGEKKYGPRNESDNVKGIEGSGAEHGGKPDIRDYMGE